MPAEMIPVTAADGHQFKISFQAAKSDAAPALLFWPGMGSRAGLYRAFAELLSAAGLNVFVADWRGIGSCSLRASRRSNRSFRHRVVPALTVWISEHSGVPA